MLKINYIKRSKYRGKKLCFYKDKNELEVTITKHMELIEQIIIDMYREFHESDVDEKFISDFICSICVSNFYKGDGDIIYPQDDWTDLCLDYYAKEFSRLRPSL